MVKTRKGIAATILRRKWSPELFTSWFDAGARLFDYREFLPAWSGSADPKCKRAARNRECFCSRCKYLVSSGDALARMISSKDCFSSELHRRRSLTRESANAK